MPITTKRIFSLGLLLCSASVMANDSWLAPVNGYINLHSSPNNVNITEPAISFQDGNPPEDFFDNENFIVSIAPRQQNVQTVEVSIDGNTWQTASLVDGKYQVDYGQLAINSYTLVVRIDGDEQPGVPFNVSEYVAPPGLVTGAIAPDQVGINQTFTYSWDLDPAADYYNVKKQRGDSAETLLQRFDNVTTNSVELSHDQAEVLLVRSQACNAAGCSNFFGTRIVSVLANVPGMVTSVTVAQDTYLNEPFAVDWTAVAGATHYKVFVNGAQHGQASTNGIELTWINLSTVSISVAACNATGCGAPSNPVATTITLNPDAPVANDDSGSMQVLSDHVFDVLLNDMDPNGSALTISEIVTQPTKGTASIEADGMLIRYDNTVGGCGGVDSFTDSLRYRVTNGEGLTSQLATLEVTMNCAPQGLWVQTPIAFNRQAPVFDFHAGEKDYFMRHMSGTLVVVGKVPVMLNKQQEVIRIYKENGTWLSAASTQAEFELKARSHPIAGALGQITDLDAADYQSVNILLDLERAPVAVADNLPYEHGTTSYLEVLGNDVGPAPLYLRLDGIETAPQYGTAVIDGSRIAYTPDADSCVDDSFTYRIINNNQLTSSAQVNVTCVQSNEPVANTDSAIYVLDTPVVIDVLENDVNASGEAFSLTVEVAPVSGTALVTDQQITYTPASGVCDATVFTYQISNSHGQSQAEVNVSCQDSYFSESSVSVGQNVTITWSDNRASYCLLNTSSVTKRYDAAQGSETVALYQVGDATWQCYDSSDVALGAPITLTVAPLGAPQNLRKN